MGAHCTHGSGMFKESGQWTLPATSCRPRGPPNSFWPDGNSVADVSFPHKRKPACLPRAAPRERTAWLEIEGSSAMAGRVGWRCGFLAVPWIGMPLRSLPADAGCRQIAYRQVQRANTAQGIRSRSKPRARREAKSWEFDRHSPKFIDNIMGIDL